MSDACRRPFQAFPFPGYTPLFFPGVTEPKCSGHSGPIFLEDLFADEHNEVFAPVQTGTEFGHHPAPNVLTYDADSKQKSPSYLHTGLIKP